MLILEWEEELKMLLSSSRYSTEAFLEKKRLFLDSWVLIEWADNPQLDILFNQLESQYSLIISTVSLLEVGFGPNEKVSLNQIKRAAEIYQLAFDNPVDNFTLGNIYAEKNTPLTRLAYNPNHHEWFAARTYLLRLIDSTGRKVENAQKLFNDALIYSCAWNARAAIVSDNVGDFVLLNTLSIPQKTQDGHLRHVPIFTVEDLKNSLKNDISYPENIPINLRSPRGF